MYIPPEPAARPAKPRRWPWILAAAIVAAALTATLTLVLLGNERGEKKVASKSTASPCRDQTLKPPCQGISGWVLADGSYESTTRATAPVYVAPTTTSPPPLTPADFTLDLKTYSKKCFGSAGCSVVVEPALTYKGSAETMASHGMCSLTYDITGDESGTVTDTLTFIGTSVTARRSVLSTPSSKTKVTVKIVSVSCT
ncbi:hypothetical protein [Amycolatopsis keratiniphila]|uniref:Uncharacterized protein n=1 Tax=Amycolatopsis keratiniphila subsp. keratiniphila TaxID=227715 RepID=A0A1W2LVZ3_9PSEU|nr:hypothetical protein [Amycolatopsis keratiniphila]ONF70222.1 hypothetical protein AVR91_0215370 [Amycolatopsis keratiniphila subsp. keratiniphila]